MESPNDDQMKAAQNLEAEKSPKKDNENDLPTEAQSEEPQESTETKDNDEEWDAEQLAVAGTDKQTKIMFSYPSQTSNEKIKIPYIEKMNGNISIKCMKPSDSEQDIKGSYTVAISFYNKSLLALKMIFEQDYQKCQIVLSMSD